MSASLVGSEMCIRDSVLHGAFPSGRGRLEPALRDERPPRAVDRVAPGAVSYTHLTLPTICSV
eukprot:3493321-Alexandrium_andersonii.AAC.1